MPYPLLLMKNGIGLYIKGRLNAHRVPCVEDDLLPALVQSSEGFAASENLLIGRKTESGGDAPTEIDCAPDKRER